MVVLPKKSSFFTTHTTMLSLRPLSRATVSCARVHAHSVVLVSPRVRLQPTASRFGLGLRGNATKSEPPKPPAKAHPEAEKLDENAADSATGGRKDGAKEPLGGESMFLHV